MNESFKDTIMTCIPYREDIEDRHLRYKGRAALKELADRFPPTPKPPKPHLVKDLPKTASRLCQELVLGLESKGVPYTYVHPSQLHITYADRRFVLDARSKENKWYIVQPQGLSKGYHLSSLERFLQSVNRFNAEFVVRTANQPE